MSLEAFKLVGELVAVERDEDGTITGEKSVARLVVYAAEFDQLAAKVAAGWPAILDANEGGKPPAV